MDFSEVSSKEQVGVMSPVVIGLRSSRLPRSVQNGLVVSHGEACNTPLEF